ncbi:MAG: response regulator [Chloroflexi bacterium]|nr:response regulator [Chloroflexota bacterium]
MPSVPRIVVVDQSVDVARIVRGAFALLNRQYILVEVPAAEDVLEEVQNSTIALVVTAYDIPGEMNGIDLARRISHLSLETPVIVLAEPGDQEEDIGDAPFQYFMRPVAEPFLRGLRIALDGEAALAGERQPDAPSRPDLGPVPALDVDGLRADIVQLMRDVGAMGIILADRNGRVLVDEGATGYIDREKLAVILGPAFSRAADVSTLVGGNAWTMHYYDGERLDVFGLSLGVHYFMGLIFDGSNRPAFGPVTMFGRRAVDQMIKMIGEAAWAVKTPEAKPKREKAATRPKSAPPATTGKKKKAVAEAPPQPAAGETELEPLAEFDPDLLFGQDVDESAADDMFAPDALENLAATILTEEGDRVGYDEAKELGILEE